MASYDIATYRANQSTKRFASVGLQQAGYQVGDFAVQLQSGTNAAVAFGQQGSQLLGIFGAFGAVLGAALAVTTAIVAPLLDSAEAGGEMAKEMDNLKDQLSTLEPVMKTVANAANFMKEAFIGATNLLLNNLDRVLVYATTLAAFFAGKWVKAFVAARVATLSLSGALVTLRGALIRTGFGALIVAAGELVYQFTRLVKGAGGFANALVIMKDIALGVWKKVATGVELLKVNLQVYFNDIAFNWANMVGGMKMSWGSFLDFVSGTKVGQSLGLKEGGYEQTAQEQMNQTMSELNDSYGGLIDKQYELNQSLGAPIEGMEALREAMARADEEGKRINIRDWFGGLAAPSEEEGGSSGKSAAEEAADQLKKVQEQAQSIADTIKNSMSDAFMSVVDGTKTAKDAFKDMARSILKQLYDVLVVQQLVGSFNAQTGQGSGVVGAIMGAFMGGATQVSGPAMSAGAASAPPIRPFADGGVVNGPTVFPMANGTGLMGEAGPEAIMPLKRGKNGKLGVQSEGGSGDVNVTQVFNINGNGDEYILQKIKQEAPKIANYTQQQILDQRRRGGAMKSTFGG
jgi:lambda family phage tail tape measure protein